MREISQRYAFWWFRQKKFHPTPTSHQIPNILHNNECWWSCGELCVCSVVRRENFRALLSPRHSSTLPVLFDSVHCSEQDTQTKKNIWDCSTTPASGGCDPRSEAAAVICGRLPSVITSCMIWVLAHLGRDRPQPPVVCKRHQTRFMGIGVARIFSGGAPFAPKSWRPFFGRRQAKSTKLTAPTLQIFPAHQKCALKFDFLLCLGVHLPAWGAFTTFPHKLCLRNFFSAPGVHVHVHPVHPLATPMFVVSKYQTNAVVTMPSSCGPHWGACSTPETP